MSSVTWLYSPSGVLQQGYGFTHAGPFINFSVPIILGNVYWEREQFAANTRDAWAFALGNGWHTYGAKALGLNAWAVRDGDVAAVPVPAAAWLFGSGFIGLAGAARRKSKVV